MSTIRAHNSLMSTECKCYYVLRNDSYSLKLYFCIYLSLKSCSNALKLSGREHCLHSVIRSSLCHMLRYLAFIHVPPTSNPCQTHSARTTPDTSTVAGQSQETFAIVPNTVISVL